MISMDVRINIEAMKQLRDLVGKEIYRIKHDEFAFANTSSQAVQLDTENGELYVYNFAEARDFYGSEEDVAVLSVETKRYPIIEQKNFLSMPVEAIVEKVLVVQEHQELFDGEVKTYDVNITRGIIFDLGDYQISFEKPVWFSEDIAIRKGYDLLECFSPIEAICNPDTWAKGITMKCTREIATIE